MVRRGERYWDSDEHERFIEAVRLFGKNWPKITEHVATRSRQSIYSHAQKFKKRVEKEPLIEGSDVIGILCKKDHHQADAAQEAGSSDRLPQTLESFPVASIIPSPCCLPSSC